MKTTEEIKEWLKSHEWFEDFEEDRLKNDKNTESLDDYIKWLKDIDLDGSAITLAFLWVYSETRDCEFWKKVDDEFREWFNQK